MANKQQQNDDLFGGLENTMSFLDENSSRNNDGLFRVDLSKAKDKSYKVKMRFLPNLSKEGALGQSSIEKISHYVNLQQMPELRGFYDSPKNFGKERKCKLSELYFTLKNANDVILQERAELLQFSKKYYSYVLIIEDEVCPEYNGKVMIFQYGKQIKDMINQEYTGEITGESVNVFDLNSGKDFVLIAKEIQTGDRKYPDYKNSRFLQNTSSIMIPNKDGKLVSVPLGDDGKIDAKFRTKVKEFLLARDHEIENFIPKELSDEQLEKVGEIVDFMTGKLTPKSNRNTTTATPQASSDDFDMEVTSDVVTSGSATENNSDDDDFFASF